MRVRMVALALAASMVIVSFPAAVASAAEVDLGWGVPVPLQAALEGDVYGVELAVSASTGDAFALWNQEEGASRVGLHAARWSPAWQWPYWDTPYRLATEAYAYNLAADASGNAMVIFSQYSNGQDSLFSSRFSPVSGWSPTTPVESNPSSTYDADLAMDATGRATAVWLEWDGDRYNVLANRWAPGIGWGTPTPLEADPGDTTGPRVAMDSNGDAMAVWRQQEGSAYHVLASRFSSNSWSAPVRVDTEVGTTTSVRLAVDGSGDAIAIWNQFSSSSYHLFASNFSADSGWASPTRLDAFTFAVYNGEVALNADGVGMAVWSQYSSGNGTSAYASRFVPGAGWEAAVLLEFEVESVVGVNVAVDPSGNAMAVWRQFDGLRYRVHERYYVAGGSWTTEFLIDYSSGLGDTTGTPQIAFDSVGNVISAWVQSDGTFNSLYANRYDIMSDSYYTGLVEYDHDSSVSTMRLATNAEGHAAAVWTQKDSALVYNLYVNLYVPGTGWAAPTLVEASPYTASGASIALDPSGNAFILWNQGDGASTNVYASRHAVGGGWSQPLGLEAIDGSPSTTRLATDGLGNAMALWSQYDGVNYSLYSNYFSASEGWGTATLVEDTPGSVGGIQLAVRPSGEAVAVWQQWDTMRNAAFAASFTPAGGWAAPEPIEALPTGVSVIDFALNPSGAGVATITQNLSMELWAVVLDPITGWEGSATLLASSPSPLSGNVVAIDPSGTAMVAWGEDDGGIKRLNVAEWTPGGGWADAVRVESVGLGDAIPSDLAMDTWGNAFLVGTQSENARNSAMAARYVAGSGWRAAVLLEESLGDARSPSVGLDAAGNAFAAWPQSDGRHSIPWAARYVVGDGAPRLTITSPTGFVTSDAQVVIAGQTDPGATVSVGGALVTVGLTGDFSVTLAPGDGDHTIEVVATNVAGVSTSSTVTVRVDRTAPGVTISRPTNGATVSAPTVLVGGATEPGASVSVNGVTASVAPDGTFEVALALQPGSNTITVTAWDGVGNSAQATAMVTFDDPAVGLEQDIAASQAELAATREALNATDARATSAGGQAGLAIALAAAALGVAGLGALMAMRGGRKPPKQEAAAPPATPPSAPPPP